MSRRSFHFVAGASVLVALSILDSCGNFLTSSYAFQNPVNNKKILDTRVIPPPIPGFQNDTNNAPQAALETSVIIRNDDDDNDDLLGIGNDQDIYNNKTLAAQTTGDGSKATVHRACVRGGTESGDQIPNCKCKEGFYGDVCDTMWQPRGYLSQYTYGCHTNKLTWTQAREAAAKNKWFIASIPSQATQDFISTFTKRDMWIGLQDATATNKETCAHGEGKWHWIAGPLAAERVWIGWARGNQGHSENGAYTHWQLDSPKVGACTAQMMNTAGRPWLARHHRLGLATFEDVHCFARERVFDCNCNKNGTARVTDVAYPHCTCECKSSHRGEHCDEKAESPSEEPQVPWPSEEPQHGGHSSKGEHSESEGKGGKGEHSESEHGGHSSKGEHSESEGKGGKGEHSESEHGGNGGENGGGNGGENRGGNGGESSCENSGAIGWNGKSPAAASNTTPRGNASVPPVNSPIFPIDTLLAKNCSRGGTASGTQTPNCKCKDGFYGEICDTVWQDGGYLSQYSSGCDQRPFPWTSARMRAMAVGWFLATVPSPQAQELVSSFNHNERMWIGLFDASVVNLRTCSGGVGDWRWRDGPLSFQHIWTGFADGNAVNDAYHDWAPGTPRSDGCMTKLIAGGSRRWETGNNIVVPYRVSSTTNVRCLALERTFGNCSREGTESVTEVNYPSCKCNCKSGYGGTGCYQRIDPDCDCDKTKETKTPHHEGDSEAPTHQPTAPPKRKHTAPPTTTSAPEEKPESNNHGSSTEDNHGSHSGGGANGANGSPIGNARPLGGNGKTVALAAADAEDHASYSDAFSLFDYLNSTEREKAANISEFWAEGGAPTVLSITSLSLHIAVAATTLILALA